MNTSRLYSMLKWFLLAMISVFEQLGSFRATRPTDRENLHNWRINHRWVFFWKQEHGMEYFKTKPKKMKWNWTVRMITLVEINDTFVSGNIKPISGTVGSAVKPSVGWRINPFFSTSFTRAWYGKLQKSGMTYFHSSTFTHSPGIAVWRHLSHSGNAWGKRNKLRNWWIYECYQCFLQEHDTESSKTRNWNV